MKNSLTKAPLDFYKDKKILLAHWDSENTLDNSSQKWKNPLEKIFGKVITFSPKKNYFIHGKQGMNQKFLNLVEKEKPDVIFLLLIYDEFDPMVFIAIRNRFPEIKIVSVNSDDSWRFEDFDRYYSLFFDYIFAASIKALPNYKKDGIQNVIFQCGVNLNYYKALDLEKKYDVIFIGRPGKQRMDYLRFLMDNKIDLHIWGDGWEIYPEFKPVYHGILSSEEWARVVSQSKISISFSIGGDGKPQFKGRPLEMAASKSFPLVEYCEDYFQLFDKDEMIMFNGKEDLLKKIKYYLKNEKERNRITESAYKKIITKYNIDSEYQELFTGLKKTKKKEFPVLLKKIAYLSAYDLMDNRIRDKLKNYDYIGFKTNSIHHPLKDYFQIHSLEKSGKNISCCDYYVHSPKLKNYLLFKSKQSFYKIGKRANLLLNPGQIMVKKDYLFKNIEIFRNFADGKKPNIINNNAVFVSIPLIKINKLSILNNKEMENSFQMKFLDNLYSLYIRKRIFSFIYYSINLVLEILNGKRFMHYSLKKALKDKSKIEKLKGI